MTIDNQFPPARLTPQQLLAYRDQARRILGEGYNLFAEIVLRVLASHDSLAMENDLLRRAQESAQAEVRELRGRRRDHDIELEFLTRENGELRAHIAEIEIERKRLTQRLKEQQQELSQLKRQKLKLPPSWNNRPPMEK